MVVLAEYHHPAFPVGNHWQKRTQKMKITVVPGGGLLASVRHRKTWNTSLINFVCHSYLINIKHSKKRNFESIHSHTAAPDPENPQNLIGMCPKKIVVDGQWMFIHPFSSPINIGKSWITNHQSWNILRITWKILSCRSHDLSWPGSWKSGTCFLRTPRQDSLSPLATRQKGAAYDCMTRCSFKSTAACLLVIRNQEMYPRKIPTCTYVYIYM